MGRLHARVYSQMPQVRLAGVYDSNPEAAQSTAGDFGGRAFDSLDAVLAEARAVSIAAPTGTHADLAERCLARGVARLVEKPLAKDVPAARRIVDAARRCGCVVQVG